MDPNIPTKPVPPKKLPQWMTTVTPLSKTLALSMFIILPFLGFYFGMKYQQKLTINTPPLTRVKYIPAAPTATPALKVFNKNQTDVSKLPKDKCPCWDGIKNTCLPLSACQ